MAVIDGTSFGETPSTRTAAALVEAWGQARPLVVVVSPDESVAAKSFRNLSKVLVLDPSTLDVSALVWARSLLVSETALAQVKERAR
jgi:ribosomal protein L4